MADYMAQMLNELMGPQRNALPGQNTGMDFDHPDICRDFLVGFCFHEVFRNTKNDQGFCPKINHDENLKSRYKESKRHCRLGYEEKFLEKARRFMSDVRRKINTNEERLRSTQGDSVASAELVKKREDLRDRREALTNRIQELVDEARHQGERGNVDAAREAVNQADDCTKEKELLDKEEEELNQEAIKNMAYMDNTMQATRQMQVCQICGCFMLVNDAQSRIDDHLSGKLHMAYIRIQEMIDEVEKEKEEARAKFGSSGKERSHEAEEKPEEKERGEREKDRGDRRDRDRDRKDRDRKRDSHRRSRSPRDRYRRDDRDRRGDRDRKRSRSRDRHRR